MNTPQIVLTRIDNRLVHGQVGVVWTSSIGANLLLVVNDDTAQDELQQQLMAATAETSGVGIRFWTVEKTIKNIFRASPRQKIFLVVRTPQDVRRLVEGGVPIDQVNIGNMHYSEGKTQVTKYTYMDQADKDDLLFLADQGVDVYVQEVPEDKKQSIRDVI
ncbi:PTS galactosamine transporter subunit IIB [Liquorilactobacillus sicerae]|uniref:PTS galactosamine transporter subunit IIB n=1 Tax=Liquorilactobacillus sicerae TaxID=1416943 RepID=UPI00247FCC19|nr:PTS galactosamine transporter subunit IIB [Liquorilactobacillus sicerae]